MKLVENWVTYLNRSEIYSRNNSEIMNAVQLITYLYDTYHCCVYSEKLPMMDRGAVRNM